MHAQSIASVLVTGTGTGTDPVVVVCVHDQYWCTGVLVLSTCSSAILEQF
jgi:hypothetical protein